MSKPRIYEIAKHLNVSSKEIVEELKKFDIDIKNHMSTLNENELDIALEIFTQKHDQFNNKNLNHITNHKSNNQHGTKQNNKIKESKNMISVENKKETSQKAKRYNTRPESIDLDKLNYEGMEELIPQNVDDKNKNLSKTKKIKNSNKKAKKANTTNNKKGNKKKEENKIVNKDISKVCIPEQITVGELCEKINKPSAEVIKKLMMLGIMAPINKVIDFDTASLIAEDFNIEVEKEEVVNEEDLLLNDIKDDPDKLKPRSPVVVVMGHVDHGKTSLLDAIRQTKVTATEAGGITQHIGAYRIKINDKYITFLDTPGHEAFTAMRARGAQATDIAILVVAADDGIMPQTVEAINHARAANISIVVAINKIDKPGANPDRVKQQLTEYNLVPEEWGGDTICVPVSALKHEGIDQLLEMVLLVAEMNELKANPDRLAKGIVIEAELDKGRGPVATVLVQNGTLNKSDVIVTGTATGKVRAMVDDRGKRITKAGPAVPVEILGLSEVPQAGDAFYVVKNEKIARTIVEKRKEEVKQQQYTEYQRVSLDDFFEKIKEGETKELNVIIKADVQGSVEAVKQSLIKLVSDEVKINIIHGGVGTITESDVMLASASNAIIIGFNVRPNAATQSSAKRQKVEIRLYSVIYEAINDIDAAMKGLLEPKYKEVVLGHAQVRTLFKISGVGTIAGCYITDGKINRNCDVRIVRDGVVVHKGTLSSLKRFKDDVKEVSEGYECGIGIERFNDIKEQDVVECYMMEEVK